MAIKIRFDSTHNAEQPTLVLATKSGRLLGKIPANNIRFRDCLNARSELGFNVNKADCSSKEMTDIKFWEQIKDFRLVWVKEWNAWFEIYVELSEADGTQKTVQAYSLGEIELSQINLYNIEINTETDIERSDYEPTVLFDEDNPSRSLLDRITEKAPHYKIRHVDDSIANIQRTFSFNNTTIYDAFQEISQEIDCLFVLDCYTDGNGSLLREINVYDLESYCFECGYRGEFSGACPECGSKNVKHGYGNDTTIFVSTENLADNVTYDTDEGSVKNCFKLEAGDDLMTATVINCNPNGSGYIWYIPDEIKDDMSVGLNARLGQYDDLYEYFQNECGIVIGDTILNKYNALIDKYKVYSDKFSKVVSPVVGYPALMREYYNTIDFYLFLNDELMPSVEIQETNAAKEGAKLTRANISPVAVQNVEFCTEATASSAVLAMAKTIVDSRYQVKVKDSNYGNQVWNGTFTVTNYSDEEDTFITSSVSVDITGDYETFVRQKIEKVLSKKSDGATDIISLFDLSDDEFKSELKKYCLSRLTSFYDCAQSCIDILIEQGIADRQTWADKDPDMYEELYIPYYNKLSYIQNEIGIRESEIEVIVGVYDKDGVLTAQGLQNYLDAARNGIQDALDFEKFLGEELWLEFATYRREDTYSNSNYISDGLNNADLFRNALEFVEVAKRDIFKSATLQHSISASLKNLLMMKEFEPIVDLFEIGNWIRIKVDKGIYKLRLIEYEINFDSPENLSVVFSDVKNIDASGISDIESIENQAQSMASSFGSVSRQASKGKKSDERLNNWVSKGLALTNMKIVDSADNQNITWDSHGFLCTEYQPITDTYDDKQLKIINRGLYVTNDNWRTSKAGIGNFIFYNPETQKMEEGYGVIADTLVGNLILSEKVGIYNQNNSITLDENGVIITSDGTSGKNQTAFTIQRKESDGSITPLTYIDSDGNYVINGTIKINSSSGNNSLNKMFENTSNAAEEYVDAAVGNLSESLQQQIDEKVETWCQENDPAAGWSSGEKKEHVGDLWYNTSDEKTYMYNGTGWQATKTTPPQSVFDEIDGKAQIFTSQPTTPYDVGDLWSQGDTGDIMVCKTARASGAYVASDWGKASKYIDQTVVNEACEELSRLLNEDIMSVSNEQKEYTDMMLNNYKSEVGQYMTYNDDGLTLGASSSSFKTVIDNQRLAFLDGSAVVAYISNSQLYIPNAVIQSALTLGQFVFTPRGDGGVSLIWQG